MNIIRKIKLEKLGYYKFTKEEKELSKFIKEYFIGLHKYINIEEFNDYYNNDKNIYYLKNNIVIFICDKNNNIFLNKFIWNKMLLLNLNNIGIVSFTKEILISIYKLEFFNELTIRNSFSFKNQKEFIKDLQKIK